MPGRWPARPLGASTDWTLGGMTPGERATRVRRRDPDPARGRRGARAAHADDDVALIRREALARGISGGLHAREHGGQGWTHVEWFLVEEQFGRSTNALSWHVPTAYNVLAHGSPEQIDRWLQPALRGELHDAYAVTEELAGSDPSGIATTATRVDGGWRIDGEKWFVTYGDVAAVYIVMALATASRRCSWSTRACRASASSTIRRSPTTIRTGTRRCASSGVEVGEDAVIGGVGGGDELQRAWFAEERLGIAARGCGAMLRLLEETTAWAIAREQGGARIIDHQGVSFPLADSAADAAAGRLLGLEVARLADAGADPKLIHAKASMAKLFVSEAANRCADRCLQIFGGRGYTRTNVAERFWRELRVDRIWEGTSEIQRLIVARALERRGVERVSALDRRTRSTRRRGSRRAPVAALAPSVRARPGSYGGEVLLNLARLGYRGRTFAVNPKRRPCTACAAYPALEDLPEAPDAVVVAIPAADAPDVVARAGALGCGGAVVFAAGFAEAREARAAARLAAAAGGMPVCGPNGNGIVSLPDRVALWGDTDRPREPGPVALISQCGNVAVNALASRRGLRLHTVVSCGNQAVLDAADFLAALGERDGVRSVALYLEDDGDGARWCAALETAAARGRSAWRY